MNVARFSVTRPVAVTMRIASLVLLGLVCLTRLPVDLLPKVSLPTVAVITQWPNVAPEEIETQITRPIEQAVSSAENIELVSSSSTLGSSVVRVQFKYGTDMGQAAVDVLQLVERASGGFPVDPTLHTPIVFKFDPSQLPILIYGVSGDPNLARLKALLNNEISPILQSASGVASAVATGGLDRAIIVDVDPTRLQAYHIPLSQVSQRIVQENLDLPAGIAKEGETEYVIRANGYLTSPGQAAAIPVGSFNGQLVSLGQVATVRDSHAEQRVYTRLNGEPSVGMIIVKQSEANTVDTARAVFAKIAQIKKLYPNLKWGLAYDQSAYVINSVDDVKMSALIGGLLAVLILLMFLRNVRSTLVVSLSIPTSIISTFTLLYMCHFTLNTLSLSGLSLATGLIVDDAVVVLENIFRHIERDRKRPAEAAVTATNEISSAVVASTLTVMVVFLPLLLIQGLAGQMFLQFAMVVIFAMGISLLDAMTVVPMLASRLIREEEVEREGEENEELAHGGHPESRGGNGNGNGRRKRRGPFKWVFDWFGARFIALDQSYRRGLRWAIHHRVWVIGGAAAAIGATFLLAPQVGTELLPQTDSGNFNVTVKLPIGTALSVTNRTMLQAERIVRSNPDVETVFAAAGSPLTLRGTSTSLTPNQGSMTVRLKDNRKHTTAQVMAAVQRRLSQLPGARSIVTPFDLVAMLLAGGNQNVEVDIYGQNLNELSNVTQDVLSKLRTIPGMENADVNVQDASPELEFDVDRQKALQLGVSFQQIASAIDTATNGALSSYYQENGYQYPIYVQLPEADRKTFSEIENIPINTVAGVAPGAADTGIQAQTNGSTVTLGQVATLRQTTGPNEILRQNSQRYIGITAVTQGRAQSDVLADVQKMLDSYHWPKGYYWEYGLQQQQRDQEFAGLGLAVFMAIALIYMLLASQFESFVYPLTILMSVPLASVGVALALFLTGRAFGLTAFVGLLLLVGIVVKNGILLIDYTNRLRARGLNRDEAVLTASPTRLRPILMTTCAAILGMLPLALALGRGSEIQAPLATAVIGGLATSTLLTLFVVPVVYTLFDDLGHFFSGDRRDLAPPAMIERSLSAIGRGLSRGDDRTED